MNIQNTGRIVFKYLSSNKITLILLLIFALSMASATFIENDFNTATARALVYNALWFEIVEFLLCVNFIANVFKYRLFKKNKLPVFIFHIAFVIILIGAFVTRYFGFEGIIKIREGMKTNIMIKQNRLFSASLINKNHTKIWEYKKYVNFTEYTQPNISLNPTETNLNITLHKFIPYAIETVVEGKSSDCVIEIVMATNGKRKSYWLEKNKHLSLKGYRVNLENKTPSNILIFSKNNEYYIKTDTVSTYFVMATQQAGTVNKNKVDKLQLRALYKYRDISFVVKEIYKGKKIGFETAKDKNLKKTASDLLFLTISDKQDSKNVIIASQDGVYFPPKEILFKNQKIQLFYGPELLKLPFNITLTDFQLERYPGSISPSSYASEVIVENKEETFPFRIYMNHVLDIEGFRLFQASYDMDEKGTILSVNNDFWGTSITYLGYFLMILGMILSLFMKNTRFNEISNKLKNLKKQRITILIITILLSFNLLGQKHNEIIPIQEQHAERFGKLLIQDMDGRIKPINTLASEFLRKVSRKNSFILKNDSQNISFNCNQLFLSIHVSPWAWQYIDLIKIDPLPGRQILKDLKKDLKTKYLSFRDLLNNEANYVLETYVQEAKIKKPSERNLFDKEVINVDERFNILYNVLAGNYLKIFPIPNDSDNTWVNQYFKNQSFKSEDSLFVSSILHYYFNDIRNTKITNDWTIPNEKLSYIEIFQNEIGKNVIPDKSIIEAEIYYNKLNLFGKLFPYYWIIGIFLIVLAIWKIFNPINKILNALYKTGIILSIIGFTLQTSNIILRWYVAQYPPWSNGYEMLILVSWGILLFGIIFYRKSIFIMPLANLFTGTLLFISFLDWLNPEITNLVPVLKSYWLKIHVAIIVSSYAPLALSAIIGVMVLILMLMKKKVANYILELTYVNELSITIGVIMLSIGTFLGGIWANESWGRYWGWDPKETWALISIICYAFVLHMRFIPKLKTIYTFNLASIIAFFSIIMTSYGVNYYLSGLHSYAKGDPLPIPQFVWWVLSILFILSTLAYRKQKRFNK